MQKLETTDDLCCIEAVEAHTGSRYLLWSLNWYSFSVCNFWLNIRGSMQVKLVAVLDVKHEIASVQVLHHKEEVLLDAEIRRGQDSEWTSTDG